MMAFNGGPGIDTIPVQASKSRWIWHPDIVSV